MPDTTAIDFSQIPYEPLMDGFEDRVFAMDVLSEALEGMNECQTRCLVGMLVGFAHHEIAAQVGVPEATVAALLEDAFARIRAVADAKRREGQP